MVALLGALLGISGASLILAALKPRR